MTQLQKRLIMSAFFVSLAVFTTFKAPTWFFFLFVEVFQLIALYEYLEIAKHKGITVKRTIALIAGALIPFAIFHYSVSFILMLAVLALFVFHFKPSLKAQVLVSIAVTAFGLLYVSWFSAHLLKIRELDSGPAWVFYLLLIVKGGDAGAYFVGRKLGRTKLIEHVSPNKSVEGAIGGFATSIILSLISALFLPPVAWLHLVVLGGLLGVLAQLGDLGESLIKRDSGVKDSGVIPGLGGILDMLDSLLLTIPFLYYYLILMIGHA